MSSLIPHDYRYKISSPTPVDKEPKKYPLDTRNKKRVLLLIITKLVPRAGIEPARVSPPAGF